MEQPEARQSMEQPEAGQSAERKPVTASGSPASDRQAVAPSTLYLVGTPIGNLGDLTGRAAAVLGQVDVIAAEDTRRTLTLLHHLGIRKPLESYHEHNILSKGPLLIARLQRGESLALVSDAGMPCISDPGAELVRQCVAAGLTVIVIPGPSAAITALAGSGLDTDRFAFDGFLPADKKQRRERLAELPAEPRTLILYEAPHRLQRTLQDLAANGLARRQLTLARELTKRHEEFLRGTVQSLQVYYQSAEPRGEYVLILEGSQAYRERCPADFTVADASEADQIANAARQMLQDLLTQGLPVKEAARQAARQLGLKKNDLYAQALAIQTDRQLPDGDPDDRGRPETER